MFFITFLNKETGEYETRPTDFLTEKNLNQIDKMLPYLADLYKEALKLLECGDMSLHYNIRFIKKKNGKLRRIDVPDDELRQYMKKVIYVFNRIFKVTFPSSVYSYIKGRNTKQLVSKHLHGGFLLHMDISNFFHSCTLNYVLNSMMVVYPFSLMDIDMLEVIVKACMLFTNGEYRLPQGAPTSPILSNIAMVPVDYALQRRISKVYLGSGTGTYTRYSDDIYISNSSDCKSTFRVPPPNFTLKKVRNIVTDVLWYYNREFEINEEKTKTSNLYFGDGTWILGMHLGNNEIKIGSKKKQKMKAMIFSFLMDFKNKNYWSMERVYSFQGKLAYFKYVEPQYVNEIIQKYEIKTGIRLKDATSHYIHS